MRSSIVSVALATLFSTSVIASPAASKKQCKGFKSHTANFDSLTGLPGVAIDPIPMGYQGLYWQSFNLVDSLTSNLTIIPQVAPHSPPNYIGTGLQSELLAGDPLFTTNYEKSKTASFSLESFYFGCVVTASSEFSVPSACDVTITGYKGKDNTVSGAKQVCAQTFQYNPSTIGAQMQAFSGKVKGCKDIQFALVTYSPPGGAKATEDLQSLLIDNVKYTTCSK